MRRARKVKPLHSAFLALMLACGSCAAGTSIEQSPPRYVPAEFQLGSASPVVSEGWIDSLNRYLSTVLVTTTFFVPKQGTKVKTCSGVVIHPRVVLTAGHCVCDVRRPIPPEASDTTLTDKSTCSQTATITLFRYASPENAREAVARSSSSSPQADVLGPYRGTHAYRDWLLQQIASARTGHTD